MTFGIFLAEFLVLWILRIHHLFGGDSAEFLTVGNTWSIAHPPGYPLYSFLQNVIRYVHVDPSMVLLSIVPTVITSYILYRTYMLFFRNRIMGLVPATLYVFLFPVWLYAEVPEVFALNNMFIALIGYFLLYAYIHKRKTIPIIVFFLLGLSLTNHQTILLYIPGWYLVLDERWKSQMRHFATAVKSIALTFLGFSVYLYAPLASLFKPPIDFENARTLSGFIRLVTRATYGTFRSYQGSKPDLPIQFLGLGSSFIYILLDFRIIGSIFIILGLVWTYKKHKKIFIFSLVTIAAHLVFFFYINFSLVVEFGAATFERFLISYYYILILLFGFGFHYAFQLIDRIKLSHPGLSRIKHMSFYGFGILLVVIIFISNYRTIRYVRTIRQFDYYAQDILDSLPKNAILATTSDNSTFTVDYYYFVQRYRPDIKLLSIGIFNRTYYQQILEKRYPELDYSNLSANNLKKFIATNSRKFPVFFETPTLPGYWVPYGLVWKYYADEQSAKNDSEAIIGANTIIWTKLHILKLNTFQSNIYHLNTLRDDYVGKLLSYSRYLFSLKQDALSLRYIAVIFQYDPGNKIAQGLLLRIKSRNNACSDAKKTYAAFRSYLNMSDLTELGDALSYMYYCDKYNPEMPALLHQYRIMSAQESTIPTTPNSQNTVKPKTGK